MNTIVRIFLYVLLVIIISDLIYNVVSCIYSAAKDTKKYIRFEKSRRVNFKFYFFFYKYKMNIFYYF